MKRPPRYSGDAASVGALNALAEWAWRNLRVLPGPGISHTGDGVQIRPGGNTQADKWPLQLYAASPTEVAVCPGAVTSSNMDTYAGNPTIDGDELTLVPLMEPTDDATTTYYLKVTTVDLDVTAVIILDEDPSAAVDDGTTFWLSLGTVVMADGVITAVNAFRRSSLVFQKCASETAIWGPA